MGEWVKGFTSGEPLTHLLTYLLHNFTTSQLHNLTRPAAKEEGRKEGGRKEEGRKGASGASAKYLLKHSPATGPLAAAGPTCTARVPHAT